MTSAPRGSRTARPVTTPGCEVKSVRESFVTVTDGGAGSSKPSKKCPPEGLLRLLDLGDVVAAGDRNKSNDVWDKKFEGQRFGEWSAEEKDSLKNRIKDWAAAHGELTNFEGKLRSSSSNVGRSRAAAAPFADSERKAFLGDRPRICHA